MLLDKIDENFFQRALMCGHIGKPHTVFSQWVEGGRVATGSNVGCASIARSHIVQCFKRMPFNSYVPVIDSNAIVVAANRNTATLAVTASCFK